ncbi:MAG: hypothetical protein SPI08_01330, partial [Campylobacter sp.]|nr:hypothetical protein [Campylobacter sp.]
MKVSNAISRSGDGSLVAQIAISVLIGAVLGYVLYLYHIDSLAVILELLGSLFVGALKAIAPIVVFVLICESIATKHF